MTSFPQCRTSHQLITRTNFTRQGAKKHTTDCRYATQASCTTRLEKIRVQAYTILYLKQYHIQHPPTFSFRVAHCTLVLCFARDSMSRAVAMASFESSSLELVCRLELSTPAFSMSGPAQAQGENHRLCERRVTRSFINSWYTAINQVHCESPEHTTLRCSAYVVRDNIPVASSPSPYVYNTSLQRVVLCIDTRPRRIENQDNLTNSKSDLSARCAMNTRGNTPIHPTNAAHVACSRQGLCVP